MADLTAPAEVVAYANELALLPFWAEFDAENALTQYREKLYKQLGGSVDVEGFKQLWLLLGLDKVTSAAVVAAPAASAEGEAPAPEGEAAAPAEGEGEAAAAPAEGEGEAAAPVEGGSEAAAAPVEAAVPAADAAPAAAPAPVETTSNYKLVWGVLTKDATSERVSVQTLIGSIQLAKAGYSEATFRAILKAGDHEGKGCASEEAAFTAVTLCANRRDGLNQLTRAHMRKAWRKAEKFAPAPAEVEAPAEEGGEEAAPAAPAAPIDPASIAVLLDSFVEAVQGDELLAEVLLKEVPVPIREPVVAEEAPAEE